MLLPISAKIQLDGAHEFWNASSTSTGQQQPTSNIIQLETSRNSSGYKWILQKSSWTPAPAEKISFHFDAPFLASVWHHETAEHHIDQIPWAWDHMMKGKEGRAHQRAKEEHLGPLPQIQWRSSHEVILVVSWQHLWRRGVYYICMSPIYWRKHPQKKTPAPFRMAIWASKVILITAESGADPTSFSIPWPRFDQWPPFLNIPQLGLYPFLRPSSIWSYFAFFNQANHFFVFLFELTSSRVRKERISAWRLQFPSAWVQITRYSYAAVISHVPPSCTLPPLKALVRQSKGLKISQPHVASLSLTGWSCLKSRYFMAVPP